VGSALSRAALQPRCNRSHWRRYFRVKGSAGPAGMAVLQSLSIVSFAREWLIGAYGRCNMSTAEHECTGPIKAADQLQNVAGACCAEGRQSEKKREKQHQGADRERPRNMHREWRRFIAAGSRKQPTTNR
jgi:hypothetical protein